jgi:aspartate aminotransferase
MYLLQTVHIATTPGEAFGNPENIRLSYALSESDLEEAMRRIQEALSKLK